MYIELKCFASVKNNAIRVPAFLIGELYTTKQLFYG